MRESVAETGGNPKESISFKQVQNEAASIDPELVRQLRPVAEGETLAPAVRLAARAELNRLNAEAVEVRKQLEDNRNRMAPDDVDALEVKANALETDAKNLIDVLYPTRSQDGRNLAYHRILAEQSFDADYWVSRARGAAERSGADLGSPEWKAKEAAIKKALGEGTSAESAIAEHRASFDEAIARLREGASAEARTALERRAKAGEARIEKRGGCE